MAQLVDLYSGSQSVSTSRLTASGGDILCH